MKVSLIEIADWIADQFHSNSDSIAAKDAIMSRHIEWLHAAEMEIRERIAQDKNKEQ